LLEEKTSLHLDLFFLRELLKICFLDLEQVALNLHTHRLLLGRHLGKSIMKLSERKGMSRNKSDEE